MICDVVDSPLGPLLLLGDDDGLHGLYLRHDPPPGAHRARLGAAREQLDAYFAGSLRAFDLQLAPAGTPWQRAVWDALLEVPYGETITYTELATRAGRPTAVRAAGAANGRNPLSIIVPCHRVVGTDGSLTGYGGGLPAKRWLLDHERAAASH